MSSIKPGKVIFTNKRLWSLSDQRTIIGTPVSWVVADLKQRVYQALRQVQLVNAEALGGNDVVVLCLEEYSTYREIFRLSCLEHDIAFKEVLDDQQ